MYVFLVRPMCENHHYKRKLRVRNEDPTEVHPARQQGDCWEPSEGRRPRRQLW